MRQCQDLLPDLPAALALLALAVTDVRSRRLPRPIMAVFFLAGGASAVWQAGFTGLAIGLVEALFAALPLILLRRLLPCHWRLGGGDVRLAAGLGLWLGAPLALLVLSAAAALGVLWASAMRLGRRASDIPYACACLAALGIILALES